MGGNRNAGNIVRRDTLSHLNCDGLLCRPVNSTVHDSELTGAEDLVGENLIAETYVDGRTLTAIGGRIRRLGRFNLGSGDWQQSLSNGVFPTLVAFVAHEKSAGGGFKLEAELLGVRFVAKCQDHDIRQKDFFVIVARVFVLWKRKPRN